MFIDFLLDGLRERPHNDAIVWEGRQFTCGDIAERVDHWLADASGRQIAAGSVVAIEGDFSPNSVALFLALTELACIVIPHSNVSQKGRDRKDAIAQPEHYYRIDGADAVGFETTGATADHAALCRTAAAQASGPGAVLERDVGRSESRGARLHVSPG